MDYLSPGVYTIESDQSLYVAAQSTSVTGMVGIASKGPLGVPTLVTNWPQFVEKFGSFRSDSWLAYAAKQFFDHGGSVLWVSRVAPATTLAATATLSDDLTFKLDPGAAGNGLKLTLTVNADNTFNIVLADAAGTTLESFNDLVAGAANVNSPNYVESAINGRSYFGLTVEDATTTAVDAGNTIFAGGVDGNVSTVTDSTYLGSAVTRDGLHAFDTIDDLNIVAIPGIATPVAIQGIIAYAEGRGDCIAIVGTPEDEDSPTAVKDFRENGGFNSNFAAMYWPWVKISDPLTGKIINAPVEGLMAGVYAHNDTVANPWDAPAGLDRGRLRNVLGVAYQTTTAERDVLYPLGINVIAQFKGEGSVVWGQRTLVLKPSAFDRVNVRRLAIYMREGLANTSKYLLFEPNDEQTWNAFLRFANPFMQSIQDRRGFFNSDGRPGFKVVCDNTTNTEMYLERNTMRSLIYFRPQKTAEVIALVFTATSQGVDLSAA